MLTVKAFASVVSGIAMQCALVAAFAVSHCSQSCAQTAPAPANSTSTPLIGSARSSVARDYVLGPGDQILCHVTDIDDIPDKPIRIDPNGYIDLPLAGRVEAAGLTVEQLKKLLETKLVKYINSPQISINLIDNESRPVSIVGAVNSPGVHQLQGPMRLLEVISLAGGTRADAGSKVIITRQSQWGRLPLPNAKPDATNEFSTASISLDDLMSAAHPVENIQILPNDVISIPKAEVVYVIGNVKRSGGFPLASHETMSILQALSLAEGLDRDAASKNAKIIRPTENGKGEPKEIPVNIQAVLAGKAPNAVLYANDILFVPNSASKSGTRRVAEAVLQAATGAVVYARY
jgi:polysaccharide biosynthesis/export protein